MSGSSFAVEVYRTISKIPSGRVSTYGEVAKNVGKPKASRAVGAALRANPHATIVPCHRVVKSTGELGGYNGLKGIARKVELLEREGVPVRGGKVDLAKYLFVDF